jgi:endonuclease YncB( thermonuclease family)
MAKDIAVCIEVIDGDSFRIKKPDNQEDEIRLAGVDCPELNTGQGVMAKETLSDLILDRAVSYEGEARDKYGRLIAIVWTSDMTVNVNDYMISQGCRRV